MLAGLRLLKLHTTQQNSGACFHNLSKALARRRGGGLFAAVAPTAAAAMAGSCPYCSSCYGSGSQAAAAGTSIQHKDATAAAQPSRLAAVDGSAVAQLHTGGVDGAQLGDAAATAAAAALASELQMASHGDGRAAQQQLPPPEPGLLPGKTFYKRTLPSPPAIAFSSPEGKRLFGEALADGTMEGSFKLIEQFRTQDEPAFCGLASLAMVLNSLSIDPRRAWKGPWRWFNEALLDCCAPLPKVAEDGITLTQAACLARCNGAAVDLMTAGSADVDTFRRHVREAASAEDRHIVVSYSRKQFLQTGDGHFSPIGGYHAQRDLVLILDTARFKYPPHWVPLAELHAAMFQRLDPVTGAARGYMVLGTAPLAESVWLSLDRRSSKWNGVHRWLVEAPAHLVQHHGRAFDSGAQLLSSLAAAAPVRDVPAFVAARTDQGCRDGGGCVQPAAVNLLLSELRSQPLFQVVSGAAPEQGTGMPLLAARLCFLLLLVPEATWAAIPSQQVRGEVAQLLDVSGASIVAAEAAYLRQQAAQIPVLEAESAALAACNRCTSAQQQAAA